MGALFLSKLRKYKKVRGQTVYLLFLWYIYPFCCSTEYALPGLTAEYGGTVLLTVCTVFSLFRREIRRFNGADVLFLLFVCWSGWRLSVEAEVVDNRMFMRGAGCLLLYFYFRCECPVNSFFGLLFGAGILRALWGVLEQAGLWPSCYFGLAGTGGFHNTALWGIFSVVALLAGNTFLRTFPAKLAEVVMGCGYAVFAACCFPFCFACFVVGFGGRHCLVGHAFRLGQDSLEKFSLSVYGCVPVSVRMCGCNRYHRDRVRIVCFASGFRRGQIPDLACHCRGGW